MKDSCLNECAPTVVCKSLPSPEVATSEFSVLILTIK